MGFSSMSHGHLNINIRTQTRWAGTRTESDGSEHNIFLNELKAEGGSGAQKQTPAIFQT